MTSAPLVLALNAGSSSLKAALFQGDAAVARETVDVDGRDCHGELDVVLQRFADEGYGPPAAVGHRIVHGGPARDAPAVVDEPLLAELDALTALAPLHQASGLALVRAARERFSDVLHVACFDTAFHRRLPEVAQRFALAEKWWQAGVRRYGFHGLSYEYLLASVPGVARGRTVFAHLGGGSSLAALRHGVPCDTTMGLTPTGGLVMSTRSGDLDPGALLYMLRANASRDRANPDALEQEIDRSGGLLGLSGRTGDIRRLLDARRRDPRAAMAIEVFCHSVRKHIGAMAAVLGGLDDLVFTGGIGANSEETRREICAGLEHLGIRLGDPNAACRVQAVATDEERMIARHTADILLTRS
jgi:acetate kinase